MQKRAILYGWLFLLLVSCSPSFPCNVNAFEGSCLRTRDFASAEATKGLCDRPLETFARSLF